jgi:hypothetical protein
VVVPGGETARDPDVPDGEKPFPVPLQAVALALVQVSVDDSVYGTEVGDAERDTVGATVCALELTTCAGISNGEKSKLSLIVNTDFLDMCDHPNWLELDLTEGVRRPIV